MLMDVIETPWTWDRHPPRPPVRLALILEDHSVEYVTLLAERVRACIAMAFVDGATLVVAQYKDKIYHCVPQSDGTWTREEVPDSPYRF